MSGDNAQARTGQKRFLSQLYLLGVSALVLLGVFFAAGRMLALSPQFSLPGEFHAGFVFAAVVMTVLFIGVTVWIWQRLVTMFAGIRIPFTAGFAQIALVLVGKYLPGKIWGMALRGNDLLRRGITLQQTLKANYAEQLISVHAGLVIGGLGWLLLNRPAFWQAGCLLLLLSPLAACLFNNVFGSAGLRLVQRVIRRDGFEFFTFTQGQYLALFFLYWLEWLAIGAILALLWAAIAPGALTGQDLLLLVSANAVAMIVGFFALFSPGGLGVREGVLVALLSAQLGLGEAVLLSVIFRCWLILFESMAGLLAVKFLTTGMRGKA